MKSDYCDIQKSSEFHVVAFSLSSRYRFFVDLRFLCC